MVLGHHHRQPRRFGRVPGRQLVVLRVVLRVSRLGREQDQLPQHLALRCRSCHAKPPHLLQVALPARVVPGQVALPADLSGPPLPGPISKRTPPGPGSGSARSAATSPSAAAPSARTGSAAAGWCWSRSSPSPSSPVSAAGPHSSASNDSCPSATSRRLPLPAMLVASSRVSHRGGRRRRCAGRGGA